MPASNGCEVLHATTFLAELVPALNLSGIPARYLSALDDATFFCDVRYYVIHDQLYNFYEKGVAKQLAKVIGVMSSVFVTVWVMMQGMKVMNGTMKTPMLELGFQAAKMILVLTLISLTLSDTPWINKQVEMFQDAIVLFMTGTTVPVENLIDFNIGATALIDMVAHDMTGKSLSGTPEFGSKSLLAGWLGQGGPAVAAASLLLMSKVAIAFGIMLAPLFLFFLLFEKTSSLFWQWAKYLLSLFFGVGALSIVATIALNAMSYYGFMVFLSLLVNEMENVGARQLLVALITQSPSGADKVDVEGGLTRLAMMGAFFSALIAATPVVVMTYFGAVMNVAAQGLERAIGGKALGGTGAQVSYMGNGLAQNAHELNVNNAATANHYGAPSTASMSAGSEVLNYQAMHHINNAQQPTVSNAPRPVEAGSPGRLANAEGFVAAGAYHAAGRAADSGGSAASSSSSGYGSAPVTQSSGVQRLEPSGVSYGAAGGVVAANSRGAVVAPVSPAALPGSYAAASAAASVSAAATSPRIGPVQTPVHAYPPMGVSSQRPQEVIDVASRDVTPRSPISVRPGGSTAVQRPGDRRLV